MLLQSKSLRLPVPAPAPAPAPAEPPRDARARRSTLVPTTPPPLATTLPRGISLEALDQAKVPLERPAAPVVPGLAFPREEESLGVAFEGRVIDNRYRVLRKIGEGGMGTVYAAEHVEIGKVVAIKILHPHYSTEQELVERFRREARAASRIGHPNIIDVMDFGTTDDGCAYFIMEHLDGIDLADVLSHERRLDPDRSCEITIQVCRALAAAHAAGVIHRDLKPENIFLVARDGKADFVKVLDFGVARSAGRTNRLTNPGIAMGTPEYMAPEQAAGGIVDHRGDIYSVGALALRDDDRAAAPEARRRAGRAAIAAASGVRGSGSHRGARARAAIRRRATSRWRSWSTTWSRRCGGGRAPSPICSGCTSNGPSPRRTRWTGTASPARRRCRRRSRSATRCSNGSTRVGSGRRPGIRRPGHRRRRCRCSRRRRARGPCS